jgi:purine-cytosine permease-like protein
MTVPQFAAVFETGDAGGVLFDIFRPWGAGGKAVLVLMAFSIVANIAPNTYSASLSAQTLMPLFQKIPRAIWCIFMFCAYSEYRGAGSLWRYEMLTSLAGSAIGGREHLSEVLSNFLAILGCKSHTEHTGPLAQANTPDWVAFFIVVLAEEHFIFRRRLKYDLTAYNSLSRLPVGIAGIIACCCGVGCAVVGMAQVWFIGPVGKLIGPEGGDLGFEMCAVATAIVYPPLRWIELKVFKR